MHDELYRKRQGSPQVLYPSGKELEQPRHDHAKSSINSKQRIEALQNENAAMKPKALFADSVATSKSTVLVGELDKIIRGNGVDIGATRLFHWMREHGYLINRKGSDWNIPTQRAMDLGLFKIKETTINHSNGTTSISKTPKVTGKGKQYFINKFLKGRELVEAH